MPFCKNSTNYFARNYIIILLSLVILIRIAAVCIPFFTFVFFCQVTMWEVCIIFFSDFFTSVLVQNVQCISIIILFCFRLTEINKLYFKRDKNHKKHFATRYSMLKERRLSHVFTKPRAGPCTKAYVGYRISIWNRPKPIPDVVFGSRNTSRNEGTTYNE